MSTGNITAANSVLMLSIESVYTTPQQIQGFAAEDIFTAQEIDVAETMQGIDGEFAAGFIFQPSPWDITLMADSDSNDLFDNWYAAEQSARSKFRATMTVLLPSVNRKWTMLQGVLKKYTPAPPGKKVLQPRKYTIEFGRVQPAAS